MKLISQLVRLYCANKYEKETFEGASLRYYENAIGLEVAGGLPGGKLKENLIKYRSAASKFFIDF